jgi:hypothetical protein
LQKEIFKKSRSISSDEFKSTILNSFDEINLDFLKIIKDKDNNKYIHKRAYIYPLLYFLDNIKCGQLLNQDKKEIQSNILLLRNEITSFYNKFIDNIEINLDKEIKLDDNLILINNNIIIENNKKDLLIQKLNELLAIIIEFQIFLNDSTNYSDIISEFYNTIGLYLNVIVDKIIKDEINLFEFSTKLTSDISENEYIFKSLMNRLTVLIDNNEWYIYYINYNINISNSNLNLFEFDNSCSNYKFIVKIIPKEFESINKSGLDNGFILAGLIQCKPIDYIIQVKNIIPNYDEKKNNIIELSVRDINIINSQYYFIGKYVNNIFEKFEKYNDFQNKKSIEIDNLNNKYLKYKKKYLSIKKK